ncbi:hypothetical protein J6358_20050 [Burkholderia pseudomallei]|uniref:hypothetical protein n=1 Tax=Burkholderia pseudomallei TaxID=28450 RepID=UPI001AD72A14|nr:hypothetical protein [Burkholderia pseudomallei]MBO7932028.1 hypothetical protein [Burkholderia pseudomallei]
MRELTHQEIQAAAGGTLGLLGAIVTDIAALFGNSSCQTTTSATTTCCTTGLTGNTSTV